VSSAPDGVGDELHVERQFVAEAAGPAQRLVLSS
jgi:hypothetical protein